ncbi:MAG: DNA-binding protein WhiA [Anaeroplasmataceae bacterium]|nr:DNA-binding protein WhiA [Anaeroplasmataceae bacterium]
MSFSFDVKEDILKVNSDASVHLIELEASLRLAAEIVISNPMKLIFRNTNLHILRYFVSLVKKFYTATKYEIASITQTKLNKKTIYSCTITENADVIIKDLELLREYSNLKEEIILNPMATIAYLRGAFLAKGSVNDPKTSNYHLEISTDKDSEALFLQKAMNQYNLNARIAKRRSSLIVYIKEKDCIVEFLRRLGANVSMNAFENEIIKRELSANINRILNIEVANQQKTNRSAKDQLKYIKYLEYNYPLEKLDSKLLLVMKVRKENPEASLNEMIKIINEAYEESITKSGLNHRLRKIKEIAIDYELRRSE